MKKPTAKITATAICETDIYHSLCIREPMLKYTFKNP